MLTLLGATGYTGRLCAAEAVREGLPLRLAGRRADALADLASNVGADDIRVVDVADPAAVRSLAQDATVLLTTVGPYEQLGRPVMEAALAGQAHYIDVTGEVGFLAWAHDQHDLALVAGVTAVPGAGFDGVPGELLAALAARALGGTVDTVRVAYAVTHGRLSRGTVRSALGVVAAGGAARVGGWLVAEPAGAHSWGAPFSAGARGVVSFPLPELVTVGRSVGAPTVRTFLGAPLAAGVPVMSRPAAVATRLLAATPLWRGVQALAGRLPEGPEPAARARTSSDVVVEVTGPAGTVTATATVADPYLATARAAIAVAGRLLDGQPPPGVLTPSQLVGVDGAAALLAAIGADWAIAV